MNQEQREIRRLNRFMGNAELRPYAEAALRRMEEDARRRCLEEETRERRRLEEETRERRRLEEDARRRCPGAEPGACGLYLAESNSRLKIGISKNPTERAGDLATGAGSPVLILGVHWFSGRRTARAAERAAHKRFAHLNIAGEWFMHAREIREWWASLTGVWP